MDFEAWYCELRRQAAELGIPWLISEDRASYEDRYTDGDSPEECLVDEIYYADWE